MLCVQWTGFAFDFVEFLQVSESFLPVHFLVYDFVADGDVLVH